MIWINSLNIEGRVEEIDIFTEDLTGLALVDLEFNTVKEKINFKMPSMALADVTQEEFVADELLAGKKI